jgi:hypothetical protein
MEWMVSPTLCWMDLSWAMGKFADVEAGSMRFSTDHCRNQVENANMGFHLIKLNVCSSPPPSFLSCSPPLRAGRARTDIPVCLYPLNFCGRGVYLALDEG